MVKLSDTKGGDWSIAAKNYRKITGELLAVVNNLMLSRANTLSPFSRATGILDNGCGPGPMMSGIIDSYGSVIPETCTLTCADFSLAMVEQVEVVREQAGSGSLWRRVESFVQNAMNLDAIADVSQTHVLAGMVYFMTPSPAKCLGESLRVLEEGGVLAVSSWQGSQWLDIMHLLAKVRPDKMMPSLPEEWSSTAGVEGELTKAGFRDVETHTVEVKMAFETREALVEMMLTKIPHMVALTRDISEEEMVEVRQVMVAGTQKLCADEPGALKGVALVGVGRK